MSVCNLCQDDTKPAVKTTPAGRPACEECYEEFVRPHVAQLESERRKIPAKKVRAKTQTPEPPAEEQVSDSEVSEPEVPEEEESKGPLLEALDDWHREKADDPELQRLLEKKQKRDHAKAQRREEEPEAKEEAMGRPITKGISRAEIAKDYESGMGATAIAAKYGITDASVHYHLNQAGVKKRPRGGPRAPKNGTQTASKLQPNSATSAENGSRKPVKPPKLERSVRTQHAAGESAVTLCLTETGLDAIWLALTIETKVLLIEELASLGEAPTI